MINLKQIIITIITILILDYFWLTKISKKSTQKLLKGKLKKKISYTHAILTYILIIIGINLFVLQNSLSKNALSTTIIGAIYGFTLYGIYDLTNLASLKNWSEKFAITDMLWGTFLCATTSLIASLA